MKHFFLLFIAILLFSACAQQNQALSGGPKDSIPPQIVYSNPNYNDTSFTNDKIVIKFDEYFKLNNINAEFFSSPPFKEMPNFKVKGKKIIIKLKEKLKDSVTYFLNFGNSIVDYHENNELKNFNLFFSTYNQIDTLKISGKIVDACTQKPIESVYVMLYDENYDSIPFKKTPTYLAKTDSAGNFTINNIKEKKYKIFALEDKNNNFIFNEDESKIGFTDSLIKPWVTSTIQHDTLDSGTVFIDPKFPDLTDTLKHDTIISKIVNNYFPNNIQLNFFTEENAKQEIIRSKRSFKNSVKLTFLKDLRDNYVKIKKFNKHDSTDFSFIKEEFSSKDSIYLWFTGSNFFSKDSMNFLVEYKTSDTTFNTDTIELTNYNYSTDTLPIRINSTNKSINSYNNFSFTSEALIKSFDSTKISLFQIVDTLVEDTKIQNVKTIRPELDSLIFIFDRPIVKNFDIIFDNYSNSDNLFYWSKNNSGDTIFCKLKNKDIFSLDTLKFEVFFDNLYFFEQTQVLSKKFKIPITEQKKLSITRKLQDSIIISFNKNISAKHNIEIQNFKKSDFDYTIINNNIIINIKNKKAINTDTLNIILSIYDRKLSDGVNKYYNDTLKAIFTFDEQKIEYIRRFMRSKILIGFKKTLLASPKFELLSFNPLRKWYRLSINKTKDTIGVDINNQRVIRLNNMKLRISYFDINQHNDTLFFSDTLLIKIKKLAKENTQILGREIKLTLKKPIDFRVAQDSSKIRNYYIKADYLAGEKYELLIDSACFKDYNSHSNDSTSFSFDVFSPQDLASLSINIKNIWAVLNNISDIDTSSFYQIKGQLMLLIEDEEGDIFKQVTFSSDKTIKDAMFLPGVYKLRLIYDENGNNHWDTGNYLKHKQAEKVYIYEQTIKLEKSDEQNIIWDLADTKKSEENHTF